ncbi:MAG: OmpA family protein [Desulforhopalus sp.]|nr:OmpA family protein [Desulforhopalus sp.]
MEISDFPAGAAKNRYASHFVNIDRRAPSNTVFHIDDNTFTSSLPRASHWSIAWSDLMMTMFVLFLSMFAYQTANQEFLVKKTPEIIGGDTTEALQSLDSSGASFPFAPIHPGLPLVTGGTVKKVEQVEIESFDPAAVYPEEIQEPLQSVTTPAEPDKIALLVEPEKDSSPQITGSPTPTSTPAPAETILEPRPLVLEAPEPESAVTDQFQEIYTMSKGALKRNNLDKFAAIDIIPDKTMRIILTGDLLFDLGQSVLSWEARTSLQKVIAVIQQTPYMINVVGHTDNLPMRSNRFISNWELSIARASSVVRFLIDEMEMNPNQFVVSGYSSYRPIKPNTTAENRAKNRRVEIIISKRLPNPLPATAQNLK